MTKKIFKRIMLVVIITVLLMLGLFIASINTNVTTITKNELRQTLKTISLGIEQNGLDYLKELDIDTRITYIDQDGKVIFDNIKNIDSMSNHLKREEIKEANDSGIGIAKRYSESTKEVYLYYAQKLDDGSILRLAKQTSNIYNLTSNLYLQISFGSIFILAISFIGANKLSKALVKPINELDITKPHITPLYEELNPLLHHIDNQQATITKQLKDIRQYHKEFNEITANMNEGLIVVNKDLNILSINESAKRLLNIDEVKLNSSIYQVNADHEFIELMQRAISKGHSQRVFNINDTYIEFLVSTTSSKGQITGAIVLCIDVTLDNMQQQLRNEFSTNVSHELKTPLTSILGYSEMIASGIAKEDDISEMALEINSSAKRLLRLVEDIIHISKLDTSLLSEENCEDIALKEMIEEIIKSLHKAIKDKKIKLSLDLDDIHFKGMRSVIEEIIYNLIDNGIKYNKDGGELSLLLKEDKQNIILKVKDTGKGISPLDQNHIFERFYRTDKSHNSNIEGSGLGLAIVKHGLLLHKGNIELKSKLNEGSEFIVSIPKIIL